MAAKLTPCPKCQQPGIQAGPERFLHAGAAWRLDCPPPGDGNYCPECGLKMIKAGMTQSGRNWRQLWLCRGTQAQRGCGRRTVIVTPAKPGEGETK